MTFDAVVGAVGVAHGLSSSLFSSHRLRSWSLLPVLLNLS